MKKLFSIVIILLSLLLLSCGISDVDRGRKLYKLYFNKVLKNPKSLVIHKEEYTKMMNGEIYWTLDVGAENSYGGMVRKTYKIKTMPTYDKIEVDGETYTKKDLE